MSTFDPYDPVASADCSINLAGIGAPADPPPLQQSAQQAPPPPASPEVRRGPIPRDPRAPR
jgi:hypothetical protein